METTEDLAGLMRSAFGDGARPQHVTRLRGGSKKGVYRVTLDSAPATAIVYVLDGDFPDREPMLQIVAYNTRQACLDIGVTGA